MDHAKTTSKIYFQDQHPRDLPTNLCLRTAVYTYKDASASSHMQRGVYSWIKDVYTDLRQRGPVGSWTQLKEAIQSLDRLQTPEHHYMRHLLASCLTSDPVQLVMFTVECDGCTYVLVNKPTVIDPSDERNVHTPTCKMYTPFGGCLMVSDGYPTMNIPKVLCEREFPTPSTKVLTRIESGLLYLVTIIQYTCPADTSWMEPLRQLDDDRTHYWVCDGTQLRGSRDADSPIVKKLLKLTLGLMKCPDNTSQVLLDPYN
jgi:hypothetical protein